MDRFTVLVVCTANVCRSPLASLLLARACDQMGLAEVVAVSSAGVAPEAGDLPCGQASAWAARPDDGTVSRALTRSLLDEADLVLAADRSVRGAIARLQPAGRHRLFTLTQAALLATVVTRALADDALPEEAPALPSAPVDRLRWLVGEMDAARIVLSGREPELDDIADRHGPADHRAVFREVDDAVGALARALDSCATATGR